MPPLFIGATDDYNFASAYASYLVAEAQVFAPERQEFDDMVNRKIMRELDKEGKFEYRSRPINMKDIEKQLAALKIAIDGQTIGRQQLVDQLNSMTSLDLRLDEEDIVMPPNMAGGFGGEFDPNAPTGAEPEPQDPTKRANPMGDPMSQKADMAALVTKAYSLLTGDVPKDKFMSLLTDLRTLPKADVATFRRALTNMALDNAQTSEQGASLVTNAVLTLLSQDARA